MEVYYHIEAYNLKLEHDHFMSVQNAWLSASLGKAKKIPTLKKLLRGRSRVKKKLYIQPVDEMLKIVKSANFQFGGKNLKRD